MRKLPSEHPLRKVKHRKPIEPGSLASVRKYGRLDGEANKLRRVRHHIESLHSTRVDGSALIATIDKAIEEIEAAKLEMVEAEVRAGLPYEGRIIARQRAADAARARGEEPT